MTRQAETRSGGIDQVAEEIRASLGAGDEHAALRLVADLVARFDRADDRQRRRIVSQAPPPTGSGRWDALLAGVAELLANRARFSPPSWTMSPTRFLSAWWFVSPFRSLHASALVDAPAELANRGVFLHRASLESV